MGKRDLLTYDWFGRLLFAHATSPFQTPWLHKLQRLQPPQQQLPQPHPCLAQEQALVLAQMAAVAFLSPLPRDDSQLSTETCRFVVVLERSTHPCYWCSPSPWFGPTPGLGQGP